MAEKKPATKQVKRQISSLKRKVETSSFKASTAKRTAKTAKSKARIAEAQTQKASSRAGRAERKAKKAVNMAATEGAKAKRSAKKAVAKASRAVEKAEVGSAKASRLARKAGSRAREATAAAEKSQKKSDQVAQKTVQLDRELEELKRELDALKKKPRVNRRYVSEYNVFIRKMIKRGLTFRQSVSEWNRLKRLEAKRAPSAYNQFLASQLRQGKTFTQAVTLWNRLKKGPLKARTITRTQVIIRKVKSKDEARLREELAKLRSQKASEKQLNEYNLFMRRQLSEGKTFTQAVTLWKRVKRFEEGKIPTKTRIRTIVKRVHGRTRVVVKRVRSKPKEVIKYRTRKVKVASPPVTRTVTVEKTVPVEKPVFVTKDVFPEEAMRQLLAETLNEHKLVAMVSKAVSESRTSAHSNSESVDAVLGRISDTLHSGAEHGPERAALGIIRTYFEEVARFGLKKSLSLDEVIDAYFYVCNKLGHGPSDPEHHVHQAGMTKGKA